MFHTGWRLPIPILALNHRWLWLPRTQVMRPELLLRSTNWLRTLHGLAFNLEDVTAWDVVKSSLTNVIDPQVDPA